MQEVSIEVKCTVVGKAGRDVAKYAWMCKTTVSKADWDIFIVTTSSVR